MNRYLHRTAILASIVALLLVAIFLRAEFSRQRPEDSQLTASSNAVIASPVDTAADRHHPAADGTTEFQEQAIRSLAVSVPHAGRRNTEVRLVEPMMVATTAEVDSACTPTTASASLAQAQFEMQAVESTDKAVLPATNHPNQPVTTTIPAGQCSNAWQGFGVGNSNVPCDSRPVNVTPPTRANVPCDSRPVNVTPPTRANVPCAACGARGSCNCNLAPGQGMHIPRPLRPNCGVNCGCPRCITGVDSATCVGAGEPDWGMRGPIPWEFFAQGEYVGPARLRHVDKYRLRVDDQLQFVYRITRNRSPEAYVLNIGDEIRVESVADKDLDRKLLIQPDGTITLRLLGQVLAGGRTTDELRRDLEQRYMAFYQEPAITVTPEKVNTRLEDVRATVDARAGLGGQQFATTIIPDGTVQLPAIGSVPAHGLTLEELDQEVEARYARIVTGLEVTPVLIQRAPRRIYVVGEVNTPGQFQLEGPTTVMQAIALAQGWNNGANLRNIIVFRRAEDWRLLATKVDVRSALYGFSPAPSDEIWLRDSDIVVVPKKPMKVANDIIELVFTNGIYGVLPFLTDSVIFTDVSSL